MISNENPLINSLTKLLESITEKKVDISQLLNGDIDLSNFEKKSIQTELGGLIPQHNRNDNKDYCVSPDLACKIFKRADINE